MVTISDETNELERAFLEDNSIHVLKMSGLGIIENTEVGRKPSSISYKLAKDVYVPDADRLFISCTNFKSIDILDRLEKEIGKPVVSSNSATFWAMMRKIGLKRKILGFGRLFERT